MCDLADEVESLAIALDRDLVVAARQPMAQRHPRLTALADRITHVEALAATVAHMAEAGDPTRSTPAQWQERAA